MTKSRISIILTTIIILLVGFLIAINSELKHKQSKFALFNAARDGDLEKVKQLVHEGTPINLQVSSSFGWTPLIGSIYQNKTNVARYLIQEGADVNLPDVNGRTPLMWVVSFGDDDISLAKDLIAHGANLFTKDKYGFTVFDDSNAVPTRPRLMDMLEAAKRARMTNER